MPDRDDRRLGHGGQLGRTPAALELGVEERRAPGDRALGHEGDQLAGLDGFGGGAQGLVGARTPLDPDAAHRLGQLADDGGVEHLLLAEEAHRPADFGP
jgi:hypothetical protein